MSSGLLPDHIEPLVDRLRSGDHLPIALPDVAAVTEVLMRSLESYFKSIDLTLYRECQDLADYIEDARTEISSLSPDGEDSAGIPRAGKELDAIVEATESATDTIMQAAEDLMSFESDDFDQYKDHVNTEVMKIFEACSFQDITGQRISKVVKTLNHVEDRVGKLISILGIPAETESPKDAKPILDPDSDDIDDADLLHGPALAGEGINQGEIDSLLENDVTNNPENTDDTVQDFDEFFNAESSDEIEFSEESDAVDQTVEEKFEADEDVPSISEEDISDDLEVDTKPETETSVKASQQNEISSTKENKAKKHINDDDIFETTQEDIDSLFG
ncbi:MAG: protein phosphatase CheZ [Alphaproteobacteria bacterium]|nr:protein phosphatase CheZ [Alphaproteobacteria bacterium]HPF45677.1 protein phosphatase CheZ [Emcibacteraceae bacterium]